MPSYQPVPGKLSYVACNSSSSKLPFRAYNWRGTATILDASSFTGNGGEENVCGLVGGAFTCQGVWNAQHNPFIQAPQFRLGESVSNFIICLFGTVVASTSLAIVEQWDIRGDVRGRIDFTLAVRAEWAFNDFGGNLAWNSAGPNY